MNRVVRVSAAAFVLAIFCVASLHAEGRSIHFDRYTLDDGLSQSAVNAIAQDHTGFMWFGTQDGLHRFDGDEFKRFERTEAADSLSSNWIWSLLVDSRGTLWVGTEGGLNRWDPYTETFRRFLLNTSNPTSLSNNDVRTLFEDSNGRLWVGTGGGLNMLLEGGRGTFRRFTRNESKPHTLSADGIRCVLEDSQGVLWVGTRGGGLNRLDTELRGFVHYRHDKNVPASLSDDDVRSLYEDRDGSLWVGTENGGLNRFDRETETFEHITEANQRLSSGANVRAIMQDADGVLWVGATGGLYERQPQTGKFRSYKHNPTDSSSLAGDNVMSIFQDRGGVLWAGTMEGLSKWSPTTSSFGAFTASDPPGERLSSDSIYSLAEGVDGDIWAGTYGAGLNRIDRQTGRVRHYRQEPGRPDSLGDDTTPTLFVDSRGRLWIGTHKTGLFLYDEENDRFINYRHDPEDPTSLSANTVTRIVEDSEGQFWVGTYGGGLNHFNPQTGRFIRYRHDPDKATSLSHDNVIAIEEDSLGSLWIGTYGGGLSGMDRETGRFTRFAVDKSGDEADNDLLSAKIWALHEDRRGNLWIGTRLKGLYRWTLEDRSKHKAQFRRYSLGDGLANGNINAILEDSQGNLWLSTNQGLSRFDPVLEEFRNLDRSNGLLSREFNQGAALLTRSGEMYFGGTEGISFFDPAKILTNLHRPPVVLTSLQLNNEPVSFDRPLSDVREIVMQHTDHVISFEFAALDFTAPAENQYAYKLEGFDEEWVETSSHRFASYTNLDPGNYTFRVKASNNDGLWNEEGLSVEIEAAPPPWRTWWAYSLYALSLASIVFAYARAQSQKLEKEAEYSRKLEREVQTRTGELAERNRDLEQANNQLQQASFTDSLTGLRNRRYLMSTISDDIALVDRYYRDLNAGSGPPSGKRPDFLFLIFDLDGFKEVNDTFGHAAGDRVLVQVKVILESACRSSDTVIRWGGDEFLIVGRYADRRAAEILSDRIRSGIDQHAFQLGNEVEARLSCSIGFAYYPFAKSAPTLMNWEQVVAIADRALYIAKNSGRNAWVGVQETKKTGDLPPEALVAQANDRIDRLVAEGYIDLHSSIDDEQELVWAWG